MNSDLISEMFSLSLEHLIMVAITIAIASAIALPLAVLISVSSSRIRCSNCRKLPTDSKIKSSRDFGLPS